MKLTPLEKDGLFLGWEYHLPWSYFFFGSTNIHRDNISEFFPHFEFAFLKQVHGDKVVKGYPNKVQEADGHWTLQPGLALCIQTADCLPVLFSNGTMVAAVHAGWRGLVAEIIPKTWEICSTQSNNSNPWSVAVGPHIHGRSFEVGQDVAREIEDCHRKYHHEDAQSDLILPHKNPEKAYVDLSCLAKSQILQTTESLAHVDIVGEDTFHSKHCHSYRRDKQEAGRQISFAVLTKDKA